MDLFDRLGINNPSSTLLGRYKEQIRAYLSRNLHSKKDKVRADAKALLAESIEHPKVLPDAVEILQDHLRFPTISSNGGEKRKSTSFSSGMQETAPPDTPPHEMSDEELREVVQEHNDIPPPQPTSIDPMVNQFRAMTEMVGLLDAMVLNRAKVAKELMPEPVVEAAPDTGTADLLSAIAPLLANGLNGGNNAATEPEKKPWETI